MSVKRKNMPIKRTNVRIFALNHLIARLFFSLLSRMAPETAAALVSKLFFQPAPYRVSDAEKRSLAAARAFTIVVGSKRLHCWQWGQGPAALLVHGWNGRGSQLHRFISPLRAAGYSVIAFDAPAHGESAGRTTNYFEWTDAVRFFLKPESGFDIRAVIGHSLGAAAVVNGISKEKAPAAAVLISPLLRLKELLTATFVQHGIPQELFGRIVADLEAVHGYSLDRDNPAALIDTLGAGNRILIVHDKGDRLVPWQDSRTLADTYARIRLLTTQGLGHSAILNDDAVMEEAVRHIGRNAHNGASLTSNPSTAIGGSLRSPAHLTPFVLKPGLIQS